MSLGIDHLDYAGLRTTSSHPSLHQYTTIFCTLRGSLLQYKEEDFQLLMRVPFPFQNGKFIEASPGFVEIIYHSSNRKIWGSSHHGLMQTLSEYYPPGFILIKNNQDLQLRMYSLPSYVEYRLVTYPRWEPYHTLNSNGRSTRENDPLEAVVVTRREHPEGRKQSTRGFGRPSRGPSAGPSTQRNGGESQPRSYAAFSSIKILHNHAQHMVGRYRIYFWLRNISDDAMKNKLLHNS